MIENKNTKEEIVQKNNFNIIEVDFNEKTRLSVIELINKRNSINSTIENMVLTYLDAKGIDPAGKEVDFSNDYTKIKITSKQ